MKKCIAPDKVVLVIGKALICFLFLHKKTCCLFVCVEVLRPSQPNGVMSSAVSLPSSF